MSTVVADLPQVVLGTPALGGRSVGRRALATLAVLVLLLAGLNVQLALVSLVLQRTMGGSAPATGIEGAGNLRAVDAKVWRSANPKPEAYPALAAAGVTTVVDLRAEKDAYLDDAAALAAGLDVVRMPIRDGQTPGADQIAAFVGIVKEAPGIVLVHCGAGVGRTGSMATAYLVATGQANGAETVVRNLSVGPPSVEQLWWMATHSSGADVPAPVVALSRVLDAPRRLLSGR
jgi:protein-tyrosine phosphatase